MSYSPQQNNYSKFGFTPEEEEEEGPQYSQFGFEPEKSVEDQKEKAGAAKSILLGFAEAALGIPALIQYGVNEWSRPLEDLAYGEEANPTDFEKENPLLNVISKFPESEDETSRRLRVGSSGAALGALGGIPGILAGLVGSQAGQTVREVYGKNGKFDNFGPGELAAIGVDLAAGFGTGVASNVAKQGARQASSLHPVFKSGETGLDRAVASNAFKSEKVKLQDIINKFSDDTIREFESSASRISPDRYTELTNANLSSLQRNADNMHRQGALNLISPLQVTNDQGGAAIQEAANATFRQNVLAAEQSAYSQAREAANGLSGPAPKTLEQAKELRNSILSTSPSRDQNAVVDYLNKLIAQLETVTPSSVQSESRILNAEGKPLIPSQLIEESSAPTRKTANQMIDLVQNGNNEVNYGSELREQSHRLKPILNTLREETRDVLSKRPEALSLYQDANQLHARNAETWGTNYMRKVRFTENPESITTSSSKASNLRNLKTAIPDASIQNIAERMIVDNITKSGSSSSNARAISQISPELSPNARAAASQIIDVKDPLTSSGGREVVRNEVLKDATQAINTGKRPEKILDLMSTPKGYGVVRETLNQSPSGRRIFQSFERLFIEDLLNSTTDPSGTINFKKANNIFKNRDIRSVTESIAGPSTVRRFDQLEVAASNFERNSNLYSNPTTQSFIKSSLKNVKDIGILGGLMHALHVPWPAIVAMGLGKVSAKIGSSAYSSIQKKLLSNSKAVNLLERVSRSTTKEELAKQIPRLVSEINKD